MPVVSTKINNNARKVASYIRYGLMGAVQQMCDAPRRRRKDIAARDRNLTANNELVHQLG